MCGCNKRASRVTGYRVVDAAGNTLGQYIARPDALRKKAESGEGARVEPVRSGQAA